MPLSDHSKHKRHSSGQRKDVSLREVESLFSKHLFRIIGILFLGASLWFAASSADVLFKLYAELKTPAELLTVPENGISGTGSVAPAPSTGDTPRITGTLILFFSLTLAGWLGLQWMSRWRKRSEYQIVSVFLVFLTLLILIRFYSWHVYILFSLLALFTVGYFFFGRHLSHTGTRLHFVFTWGLFLFWWLLKIMIQSDRTLLPVFFIFSTLFFLLFHLSQLFHGFAGKKPFSRIFEILAIASNLLIYYGMMVITMLKFGMNEWLFFLTLGMACFYFLTLWMMGRANRLYRKEPFVFSFLFLCSLIIPLLVGHDLFILLTGSLSVLLMFYARQTSYQPAILVSLGLMVLMILWLAKGLVLSWLPEAFLGNQFISHPSFIKGFVAGSAATLAALINRWLLKKMHISFSRKWFSRRRYLTLLKAIFLGGLYFVLFWTVQYLCCLTTHTTLLRFISWFSVHLLFCLVAIPWLASQRSSLLTPLIITGMLLTLLYPTILSLENINLLDLYLRKTPEGVALFPFHYIPSALFLLFIGVVLRYGQRSFKGRSWAKRFFLVYAVVMILTVLFIEMILTIVALKATSPVDAMELKDQLYRIPASLLMAGVGLLLLVWGFLKRKQFARTLALALLILTAGKIIYVDLHTMPLFTRILLLFITGLLFILLSAFYQRLKSVIRTDHQSRASKDPEAPKLRHHHHRTHR